MLVKFLLGLMVTLLMVMATWFFYNADPSSQTSLLYLSMDTLRAKTTDLKLRLRGPLEPGDNVAVIAVDERSLEKYGQWPWPRSQMANLISELFRHQVKAVGIDVMYPEPSRNDVVQAIDEMERFVGPSPQLKEGFEKYKRKKMELEDQDGRLAQVLSQFQESVVMGTAFQVSHTLYAPYQRLCFDLAYAQTKEFRQLDREGFDFIGLLPEQDTIDLELLPDKWKLPLVEYLKSLPDQGIEYCSRWLIRGEDPLFDKWQEIDGGVEETLKQGLHPALIPAGPLKLNTDKIFASSRYTGFLNVFPDIDGTIRQIPLLIRRGPYIIPSMGLRLAMLQLESDGGQVSFIRNKLWPDHLAVRDLELTKEGETVLRVPVDVEGQATINFLGPKYTFPHISAKEILDSTEATIRVTQLSGEGEGRKLNELQEFSKAEYLKGKTVMLGATALGLYDLRATPFDENYPGVEAHATVADNIQRGLLFRSHPQEAPYMILLILILGAGLTAAFAHFGPIGGLGLCAFSVVALTLLDHFLLFRQGVVVAVAFPVLFSLLLYAAMTIYKYFTEERQKRAVRGTFEKYVSPAIVSEVMKHPDNLKLGGRKERMSVFFSDVRGFTTISEALDPESLSKLLNLYLTPMTDLVFKNNGTLDKYMGDAIMAFFGAPISSDHHAADACRCALQNIEKLKELNLRLKEMGYDAIDVGIGINTGEMSVGNMGSESVRNYTVMGDAVNLGSRIEGINKQYGTHIIISEFTEKEIGQEFVRREIDWVKVKGKDKPVRIFELIGEGETNESVGTQLKHFRLGYHLYHQQKWQQAIEEFNLAIAVSGKDPVSQLYVSRCYEFIAKPPPSDWDGVFVMTSK